MADTKISGLSAGAAGADTDVVPAVETTGTGPVKKTLLQIANYVLGKVNLVADAANRAALRSGATPQTLRVYNTFTDASNYEGVELSWFGAIPIINNVSAGTGVGRGLYLGNGSGNPVVYISGGGDFVASSDTFGSLGGAANRFNTLYLSNNINIPGAAVPVFTTQAAITSGAAAAAGTLTNAPAAGNPTKWIPINDNGTTRYIPAW